MNNFPSEWQPSQLRQTIRWIIPALFIRWEHRRFVYIRWLGFEWFQWIERKRHDKG